MAQNWKAAPDRRLAASRGPRGLLAQNWTVWGEIKGPMAEYAGRAFTTQESLDILAYLLQQNGLAAGNQPLADTRELSENLPTK
jgi:hypothetical protein